MGKDKSNIFNQRIRGLHPVPGFILILIIAVGGYFQPLVGLTVPVLIITAAVSAVIKPRLFCTFLCPRNRVFPLLKPASRYRPSPGLFRKRPLKQGLCGLMMLCSILQLSRLRPDIEGFVEVGLFFWTLCIISLITSFILAVLYKPNAWCAICPMGTLQDTISRR